MISLRDPSPHDGLIRIGCECLHDLHLEHIISGVDDNQPAHYGEGAVCIDITGYTEWVAGNPASVTLGWDWVLHRSSDLVLERVGEPRSNLMLQAADSDLGHAKSSALLEEFIDHCAVWQDETMSYLNTHFGPR